MCQRLADSSIAINRYINPQNHHAPQHAGSEQGGVLTPEAHDYNDGVATCRFTLSEFNTETLQQIKDIKPLSQSTSYYPLFAVGPLNSISKLSYI